ncbi:MAG: AAA family ATPase [Acidiferrobacterales bacterium]|nr:AAA family ATPase [Acidiferrobacterales bacterium]
MAAEKRQLTILNCDMVGSTMLAEELDPEVFEVIIQSFIDLSVEVIERNHGVFAINTGDGYEAYFYPGTGSPGAVYAIECGLDIQRSLESLNANANHPISVRVGITTGQVVLSPHKLSSNVEVDIAFGKPAHLASRLQSAAEPWEVYVDDATRESASPYFNFHNAGSKLLKGFNQPVKLWRVDSQRQSESRFQARLSSLSPLVGRGSEINALSSCWQSASEGKGEAIVVIGEPGIGKSRLVYEACNRIEQPPIVLQCLENHENTPLRPWTRLLESMSEISPRDSVAERREKLATTLRNLLPLKVEQEQSMLSLMVQSTDADVDEHISPKQKLEELCAAIVDGVIHLSKKQTQLIVIEDLHWIDPTSQMLLESLLERKNTAGLFVLLTSRPEKQAYVDSINIQQIHLQRLTHNETMELAMSEMEGVVAERVEEIVRWADGIPLFVEEIAKSSIASSDSESEENKSSAQTDAFKPDVPHSLQDPLLARLDRLGDAKQLAQVASVIGREFDIETLSLLKESAADNIRHNLSRLVDAGILLTLDASGENLTFKHALIQDVVYKNLLDRDARQLHKRLARIYQEEFGDIQSSRSEVIAHHLSMAGEWEIAAELWLEAGVSARDTGSNLEAKGRLERGLDAANHMEDKLEARRLRVQIELILGQVISAHYGPINQEGHAAFENVVEIATDLGDEVSVVSAQTYLMWLHFDSGEFEVTLSAAAKLTDYAKNVGNHQAAALGLLGAGMCQFAMGEFSQARISLEESLRYLEHEFEHVEGYPGKAYTYLGFITHIQGDSDRAFFLCKHSIEISEDKAAYDLAAALGNSLYLNVIQHDLKTMEETSSRLMLLSEKTGFIKWYYQGAFFYGSVLAARGDIAGLKMMKEAIDRFEQSEELVELTIFYGLLADRYLMHGEYHKAKYWADKGLNLVETFGECFVEAPLLRLKARCLKHTHPDPTLEAEALFERASKVAQSQEAVIWQEREIKVQANGDLYNMEQRFP